MTARRIAVVVKGYPRLSETFIAQEILALEQRGLELEIWSLRHPTERAVHPMHKAIKARVAYLPEYLYEEPLRVLRGAVWSLSQKGFGPTIRAFWRDLKRDFTANRVRRLGQAFVMAREMPEDVRHLHVHYLHTPASAVRYAALLTGRSWTFSAHAKDIWTTPDWEKREKMAEALWGVTCTAHGAGNLRSLSQPERVSLVYHGLDLSRFPAPPESRPVRDGSDPLDPVRIVSVGRAVAKKGFGDLIQALAALPPDLHWRFAHVGGGELLNSLKKQAQEAGIADKVAFLGSKAQPDIIALLREADLFVLPSKEAKSGDRDGLPNVIMEAASQGLAIVATDFAGIPEFIRNDVEGQLVPPGDWEALSNALNLLARDPERRKAFGAAAFSRLRREFSMEGGIDELEARLRAVTANPKREPERV
ncbi:glycosyltransferase family 4 protein [Microvirga tunisiensis]|uniref:Glycosyltransferase family 4 protein n=1 Tax=Microvirga tunisiensis TaxID=2108360 RepID=A0A5N7MHK1_9HYPH|nr:glycosyltransferase family 4 protein [Microvirga tunisiensis]MPR07987.1 glycosyltransferase family 4 protein [Microvirga tunisiensis]MPR26298.1 glycosyltransferase family 4 protein [Microvirga tunisiensis]